MFDICNKKKLNHNTEKEEKKHLVANRAFEFDRYEKMKETHETNRNHSV